MLSRRRHIRSFNKTSIFYDKGSFDDWCVYIKSETRLYAPKDTEYFSYLQQLAKKHTSKQIYNDFVRIYNRTSAQLSDTTLDQIEELSKNYGEDSKEIRRWFTVIYAGMVAEENKANKKLGKRIKRLGIYQVLILGRSPEHAANYSKDKKWKYLDEIMRECGF